MTQYNRLPAFDGVDEISDDSDILIRAPTDRIFTGRTRSTSSKPKTDSLFLGLFPEIENAKSEKLSDTLKKNYSVRTFFEEAFQMSLMVLQTFCLMWFIGNEIRWSHITLTNTKNALVLVGNWKFNESSEKYDWIPWAISLFFCFVCVILFLKPVASYRSSGTAAFLKRKKWFFLLDLLKKTYRSPLPWFIGRILYIPACVHLFKLIIGDSTSIFSFAGKWVFIPMIGICGVLFCVALRRHIMEVIVSNEPSKHNKSIERKELEYLLEINDDWKRQLFCLFSVFNRKRIDMPYMEPFLLLCVTIVISCLNSYHIMQTLFLLIFFIMRIIINCIWLPFNILSLNLAWTFQNIGLLIVSLSLLLRASGTNSVMTVNSIDTIWTLSGFSFFFVAAIILMFFSFTCGKSWIRPFRLKKIIQTQPYIRDWIVKIHCAEQSLFNLHAIPVTVSPVDLLMQHRVTLGTCLNEAQEIKGGHVLSFTLEDVIVRLTAVINGLEPISVFPHPPLRKEYSHLVKSSCRRSDSMLWLSSEKRNLLTKTLAVNAFAQLLQTVREKKKKLEEEAEKAPKLLKPKIIIDTTGLLSTKTKRKSSLTERLNFKFARNVKLAKGSKMLY
eukprot:TRINITY_DN3306_c0_g1_i1.p1 TRINITY_DN3306_c0_g1~~TRINITY_DN3306_c0_g1_i1.p1  ORF type:complete len:611 (-),score=71.57 TRINITY_DN3306_c0_g1_i1:241-2073(-)